MDYSFWPYLHFEAKKAIWSGSELRMKVYSPSESQKILAHTRHYKAGNEVVGNMVSLLEHWIRMQ